MDERSPAAVVRDLIGVWNSEKWALRVCSRLKDFKQTEQITAGEGLRREEVEEEGVGNEGLKSSEGDGKGSGWVKGG